MEDPQENNIDDNSTSDKVSDDNSGHSDESTGAKTDEESQERLETKLTEAYGKQDDLQNKYLRPDRCLRKPFNVCNERNLMLS